MNIKQHLLIALFVFLVSDVVSAQNFFWSNAGFEQGAVKSDTLITADIGDSGTAFLYYDPAGIQNITLGIDLDFSWQVTDVVSFTASETFNYDITIANADVGDRWTFAGPAQNVTDDTVETFITTNLASGVGLQIANIPPGAPFTDTGYDVTANAFLVGSFDWTAVDLGGTSIQIDESVILDNDFIDVPFRSFTIQVVPEPTSAAMLVLGIVSFSSRRRSRERSVR